jgi:phosphonate transport system ATP-binding protein
MIEVAGLRVVLPPSTVALHGVDLVIDRGEFVVVLGRSGAGKTTFLRSLNRLVEPTAGTIRVAGHTVTGASAVAVRAVRRQIGMVFQQFNLVRRASAIDNVLAGRLGYVPPVPSMFGSFPEPDRALARACLDQVGLGHLAERRADTLSGGEQQRVAIARALAQRPSVILADEPTASLDPALTTSIMDILKAINVDLGLTLVVSQHQLETALAYATRIIGFRQGRVAFDGPPTAVTPTVVRVIYGETWPGPLSSSPSWCWRGSSGTRAPTRCGWLAACRGSSTSSVA